MKPCVSTPGAPWLGTRVCLVAILNSCSRQSRRRNPASVVRGLCRPVVRAKSRPTLITRLQGCLVTPLSALGIWGKKERAQARRSVGAKTHGAEPPGRDARRHLRRSRGNPHRGAGIKREIVVNVVLWRPSSVSGIMRITQLGSLRGGNLVQCMVKTQIAGRIYPFLGLGIWNKNNPAKNNIAGIIIPCLV